jgi:plastocyanin
MTSEDRSVSRRDFLRGAAGATAVAGASGTATAAESGGTQTVRVVNYAYEPGTEEPMQIAPGTTVEWVWQSDGHNIVVDSQPEGADWEGHEPIENEGFTYSHTFETLGEYSYYCEPHLSLGMEATIVVTENPSSGEGGYVSILPDSAKTLGVAATGSMAAVLGLAYFFMKYGGDYGGEE